MIRSFLVILALVFSTAPATAQLNFLQVDQIWSKEEALPSLILTPALSPEQKGETLAEMLRLSVTYGRPDFLPSIAECYRNEAIRGKFFEIFRTAPEAMGSLLDLLLSGDAKLWTFPQFVTDGVFESVTHLVLDLAGDYLEAGVWEKAPEMAREQIVKIGKFKNSWWFFDIDDAGYYRVFDRAIASGDAEISLGGIEAMAMSSFRSKDGLPFYVDQVLWVELAGPGRGPRRLERLPLVQLPPGHQGRTGLLLGEVAPGGNDHEGVASQHEAAVGNENGSVPDVSGNFQGDEKRSRSAGDRELGLVDPSTRASSGAGPTRGTGPDSGRDTGGDRRAV
jgi:hypothetical protein